MILLAYKKKGEIVIHYFTDKKDDLEGYLENLSRLKTRLGNETYEFITNCSFHDSHIYSISVVNSFDPLDDEEGEAIPTSIEIKILHKDGSKYNITWHGVVQFFIEYDIEKNTYHDSNEIVCDGVRGIDDWMMDEITSYNEDFLFHKIVLASNATIKIKFNDLNITKLQ